MNGPLISLLQAEQLSVALILVCNIYETNLWLKGRDGFSEISNACSFFFMVIIDEFIIIIINNDHSVIVILNFF